MSYDPEQSPDPTRWLSLDESERIAAVSEALAARGEQAAPVRAAVQAVVETQIALEEPPQTAAAVARLTEEGLRRPIVLRVLTVTLMQHMQRGMQAGAFDHDAYAESLDAMTGASILAQALGAPGPGER